MLERKKVTAYGTGYDQDLGNLMIIACLSPGFNSARCGWEWSNTAQSMS